MPGFFKDVMGSLDPISGQRRTYRQGRGDIREATNRYMEMILNRQGVSPDAFNSAVRQAFFEGGLGGVQQGFAALPGQFYGQNYMNDLNRSVMGQASQGALAAGRAGAMAGGQRGALFGGAAEQARRASTDLSAQTGATLAGARAQAEGARSNLALQGLQGQAQTGQAIQNFLGQGYLQGLGAEQAFRLAQLGGIGGLGQTAIGALGGLGQAWLGNSGQGWMKDLIQDWGGKFIQSGGMGLMCWVADELWGPDDERTHAARRFCAANADHPFMREYAAHGREWAAAVRASPALREFVTPIWSAFAALGA